MDTYIVDELRRINAEIDAINIVFESFVGHPDERERKETLLAMAQTNPTITKYISNNINQLDGKQADLEAHWRACADLQRAREVKQKARENKQRAIEQQKLVQMQIQLQHLKLARGPARADSGVPNNIVKPSPDERASTIAKNPVVYEEFSALTEIVCPYLANSRLRNIQQWHPAIDDVKRLQHRLHMTYFLPLTLTNLEGGSETKLVDPNWVKMLESLVPFFGEDMDSIIVDKQTLSYKYMAKSDRPEHGIYVKDTDIVLLCGEAKGVRASTRKCCSQLITVCGNSAMHLYHLGLPRDDCVALGIAVADSGVQFGAVYLMEESFPVFLQLTPPLHPFVHTKEIATWLLRCVQAARETLDLLREHHRQEQRLTPTMKFNLLSHFVKPVRGQFKGLFSDNDVLPTGSVLPGRLAHIMTIYEQLYQTMARLRCPPGGACSAASAPNVQNVSVLFPVGCITMPTTETEFKAGLKAAILQTKRFRDMRSSLERRPCIVFPKLRIAKALTDPIKPGVWRDTRPPLKFAKQYLALVREVVAFLNEARLAHFDLRPSNLLWRTTEDATSTLPDKARVEVMIIDFDDAFAFEEILPESFVKDMKADRRFPLYHLPESLAQHACAEHNNFFVKAMEDWLNHEDESVSYDAFHRNSDES